QDVHDRERDRADPASDLDHRAQQDPRGAAVRRVQGAVPRQRRPLLRQLLRLLPARGVRTDDGHLHREGLDRQRRDRSHASRGDTVEVFPAYEADTAVRIEWFGDQIESMAEIDPLRGGIKRKLERSVIFAASHYATPDETMRRAVESIRTELKDRLSVLSAEG